MRRLIKMFEQNTPIIEELLGSPHNPKTLRILGGAPGTGKSTSTIKYFGKYLDENPTGRILYLTFYHDLISEEIIPMFMCEGIPRENIRHWKGMTTICPNRDIEPIRSMIEYTKRDLEYPDEKTKIPNNVICRLCMRLRLIKPDECPHKLQFKDLPQVVVAPVHYVQTTMIKSKDFSMIAVDDVVAQIDRLPSKTKINRWLSKLKKAGFISDKTFSYKQLIDEVSTLEEDEDPPSLKLLYTIQHIYLSIGGERDVPWKDFNFIESLTPEMLNILTLSFEISLNDLRRIAYLREIYGDREQYYESFQQRIFEYLPQTTVVLVEAFPNIKFLKDQTNLYKQRTGIEVGFKTSELPFERNDSSTVVRIIGRVHGKKFWLPSESFDKSREITKKHVARIMEAIFNTHPDGHPGFISFKAELRSPTDWFSREQLTRIDDLALYYGGLRGQNKLQHCDWIILLGTYQTNKGELLRMHNGLYIDQIDIEDVMLGGVRRADGVWTYPDHPSLENLRQILDDNEMLQAIFRARPLNHNTKIYCICSVPEQMKLYCGYEERYIEDGELTSETTIKQAIPFIFYEPSPTDKEEVDPVDTVLYGKAVDRLSKIMKKSRPIILPKLKKFLENTDKYRLSSIERLDTIGRRQRKAAIVRC